MTDQLERDLTSLLRTRAESTPVSEAPLDTLVREGRAAVDVRRRRARRLTVGAAAAAVVLAAAIPLGLRSVSEDDSTPEPAGVPEVVNTSTERPASVADLPVGPPPAVPYAIGRTLHVDGPQVDVPATDFYLEVGGPTVLAVEPLPNRVYAYRGDRFELVTERTDLSYVHLSVDGKTLAGTVLVDDSTSRVVLLDVGSGREIASVDIDRQSSEGRLLGIDAGGRVFWTNEGGRGFVWAPGEEPHQIAVPAGSSLVMVERDGVVLESHRASAAGAYHYGTVADDGTFAERHTIPLPRGGMAAGAADDGLLAFQTRSLAGDNLLGSVTRLRTGETTQLLVPQDVAWTQIAAIEGGENVLLYARPVDAPDSHGGWYLRCSATSGSCDRILPNLPDLPTEPGISFEGLKSVIEPY